MKVYAITLAFMNRRVLRASIEAFYRTRNEGLALAGHVIVDQHYPLERDATRAEIERLAMEYNLTLLDPGRNLGLHDGFNWAMSQLPLADEDIIIGYDGDSLPSAQGWDMALVRAIEGRRSDGEGTVVWSSLGNPRTLKDIRERGYRRTTVDGYLQLWLTRTAITNSVCAWRVGWLRRVGGLSEPTAYYGHLEATMWGKLRHGELWAVVPDWPERDDLRDDHDRAYVIYKWRHSHLRNWPGDFASFVTAGCPEEGPGAPLQLP